MNAARAWLVVGALIASSPAVAHEGDTFRPFISTDYYADSNLFRLDENESPGTPRSDRYAVYQAGFKVDWKPNRQQIQLNATKTLTRYSRNVFLDHDSDDINGIWNWRLGNYLSGSVGASKTSGQSSFADIGQVNNSVERERRFGRAEWEIHPRWRIAGGMETVENVNSEISQRSQNFSQTTIDAMLVYRTPKGSALRGQVRYNEADYPVLQILRTFLGSFADMADNSFNQVEYSLSCDWQVSGQLVVRGQTGWVEREYENQLRDPQGFVPTLIPRPDFKGLTGRLAADWSPSGKTLLSLSAYQELGGASDINASAVLKRNAKFDGIWRIREKWRISGGLNYENRNYQGDPGIVPGMIRRNDETFGVSFSLNFTPISAVSAGIGVQAGRRDSNINDENYRFSKLFANVRADF